MLKTIKIDKETRRLLSEKLDPKLIKKRKQFKGPDLSYISANTCIDLLNRAFGHNWSMRIVDRWMEEGIPAPFTEKDGKKPVPQPPTAWCIVELSVLFHDDGTGKDYMVTKSAFGSQAINGNQSVQSTNGYKGAQSDALKKAATLFGIALELYRDGTEESFFEESNSELFEVWTDELREQYSTEFEYINTICTLNNYSLSDLAYWVVETTEGVASDINRMPPEYMPALVEMLAQDEDLIHPDNKGSDK